MATAGGATAPRILPAPGRPRGRVGPAFTGVDAQAVARAEAALAGMADRMEVWIAQEAAALRAARDRRRDAGPEPQSVAALQARAHDLKGLGTLCGFPLVTRLCASLCRGLHEGGDGTSHALVDLHVDAVDAVVRDGLRDAADPAGAALCEAAEAAGR